jgi:hypothetical protein
MDTGAMKGITVISVAWRSILLAALCCTFLFILIPASGQGADDDPEQAVFSLDFKDKPLSQVLNQISKLTGAKFLVNKEYAELKVSGSLRDVTVTKGLSEIMADLNHTIIYEPDHTISLVIYGKKQVSGPGDSGPLPPPNYPMQQGVEDNLNSAPQAPEPAEQVEPEPNEPSGGESAPDIRMPQPAPEQAAESNPPEGSQSESGPETQEAGAEKE